MNRPKTGAIPSIPQEIVDEILGHLSTDPGSRLSLQACTLVSKSWVPSCRQHLFHTILFTPENIARWVKTFPVPEESPAHLVRDLRLLIGARNSVPETFFGYIPWFKNTEGVSILQDAGSHALWIPSFRGLPQSVTSLTIKADRIFLRQIQNIIMWLPNLDDLVFSGSFVAVERGALLGIGTNLRGRFGGRLRLTGEYSSASLVNVLLEIPTGLHFTEVQIHTTCESLLSTVRLTEACAKTLVKLSYMVDLHGEYHPFSRFWRNTDTDAISRHRWPRALCAVLRLFQNAKPPRSALLGRLGRRGPTLDP